MPFALPHSVAIQNIIYIARMKDENSRTLSLLFIFASITSEMRKKKQYRRTAMQ
jgi:hypothetical protein